MGRGCGRQTRRAPQRGATTTAGDLAEDTRTRLPARGFEELAADPDVGRSRRDAMHGIVGAQGSRRSTDVVGRATRGSRLAASAADMANRTNRTGVGFVAGRLGRRQRGPVEDAPGSIPGMPAKVGAQAVAAGDAPHRRQLDRLARPRPPVTHPPRPVQADSLFGLRPSFINVRRRLRRWSAQQRQSASARTVGG